MIELEHKALTASQYCCSSLQSNQMPDNAGAMMARSLEYLRAQSFNSWSFWDFCMSNPEDFRTFSQDISLLSSLAPPRSFYVVFREIEILSEPARRVRIPKACNLWIWRVLVTNLVDQSRAPGIFCWIAHFCKLMPWSSVAIGRGNHLRRFDVDVNDRVLVLEVVFSSCVFDVKKGGAFLTSM